MKYQKTTLENGLRVITIPMPSFESSTVMILVGAGSRYEGRTNNGISHFLEHMAFKGTKKRPSALAISSLIDGIGGEFNAFTGKETVAYHIRSAATHLPLCLDVLSDMLQHSKLQKSEIEKERGVILEEINLYEDTPAQKIDDVYYRLVYGDTPLGRDIAGDKDVIRSLKREDFTHYMQDLYSPTNIVVVVAGGIDSFKVRDLTEKYFGDMKSFDTLRYKKVVENQKKPQIMIKKKKTEQVHIALGVRTVSLFHEDHYPLIVLAAILGGGMSSRLFHEVREKRGLSYYVRTSAEHHPDVGNLISTAGLDPKRVNEGISVMVEEYGKISNSTRSTSSGQISNSELKKAKEYIKGHMVLELENSRAVCGFYAYQELLEKRIRNPLEIIKLIDKVTLEDIERAAKKYFVNSGLNLAIIGNFDDGVQFEKLLKL